jgi:hypothetical protein
VVDILESICAFEARPLRLDQEMIERIANMYFTHAAEKSLVEELAQSGTASPGEDLPAFAARPVRSIFAAPDEPTAKGPEIESALAAAAAKALAAEGGPAPEHYRAGDVHDPADDQPPFDMSRVVVSNLTES